MSDLPERDHIRRRRLGPVKRGESLCPFLEHRLVDDGVSSIIDSVRWPTMAMAVERGTPARSRLRTAVRRKSCGIRSGKTIVRPSRSTTRARPARRHAVIHARRNDRIRSPSRWKSHGSTRPVFCSNLRVAVTTRSSTARNSGSSGNTRPLRFFVLIRSGVLRPTTSRCAAEAPHQRRSNFARTSRGPCSIQHIQPSHPI